jgi:hypothetical protein
MPNFSFFLSYQTLLRGYTNKNLYNLHILFNINVPHLDFAFLPMAETFLFLRPEKLDESRQHCPFGPQLCCI